MMDTNYQELFERLTRELCVQWAIGTWDFKLPDLEVPEDVIDAGVNAFTGSFSAGNSRSLAQMEAMLAMQNALPVAVKQRTSY